MRIIGLDLSLTSAHKAVIMDSSGMVPGSSQSAGREGKGLRISQVSPILMKKYAFFNADVAHQWDP